MHTNQSFHPPPRRATASSGNISNPLQTNPKFAASSMLVDARTKPHLACASTNTNVSSATAITQRPRVPVRAPINKHKLDTQLQPEVFAMSLHNHPDRMFVESLLWSLHHGFNLSYNGAGYFHLSSNLKAVLEHKVNVQQGLGDQARLTIHNQ